MIGTRRRAGRDAASHSEEMRGAPVMRSAHRPVRLVLQSRVPRPGSRLPRGFGLLELVAALALFAVASAVLYGTLAASLHGGQRAVEISAATLWGESLLDTLGTDAPLRPGVREGRFDARYRWRLTVAPWQPPQAAASPLPSPIALYRVDLEVLWDGAAGPQRIRFGTLRALTAPAAGAVGGGP